MRVLQRHNGDSLCGIEWLLVGATVVAAAVVVGSWVISALYAELNSDAGYYVSLARLVAQGLVPYIDFPSEYAPGGFYLLSIGGEAVLTDPALLRAFFFAFHVANAALLVHVLRALGTERAATALWTCIFLLWTWQADGAAIVLEPFQVTFLLGSVLALLKMPGVGGLAAAGLMFGSALLVKQYTLLMLPGLLLLANAGRVDVLPAAKHTPRRSYGHVVATVVTRIEVKPLNRIIVFGSFGVLPYLAFALLSGQSLPENLLHIATFGGKAFGAGSATGAYEAHGFAGAAKALASGGLEFQLTLAVLAAALVLIVLQSTRTNVALALCMALPLAQLYVRGYPHYLQVSIPWAVTILALLASIIGRASTSQTGDRRYGSAALFIAALPFLGLLTQAAYEARVTLLQKKLEEQQRLAQEVVQTLSRRDDVVVLNGAWLYLLADLKPPGLDYRFADYRDDKLLQEAKFVVLIPTWEYSSDIARERLNALGFDRIQDIEWRDGEATLFRFGDHAKTTGGESLSQ